MRFLEHPVYCVKLCVIRKHLLGGFCYIFHKWSNSFVCVSFCWNASEVDIIWTIIYQVAQIFCWSSLSVCVSLVFSASLAVHECTGKGVFGFPLCHDGLKKLFWNHVWFAIITQRGVLYRPLCACLYRVI